jgi:hypothetical protein
MTADQRRLLELLAASNGCTDAFLLAHGFAPDIMVDMVRAGLATAKADHTVTLVWITEAGRRALAERQG